MPLSDDYPLAVTFIVSPTLDDHGAKVMEPIGTGFIVNTRTSRDVSFEYVVTAAHVVEGRSETYARIRTRDGGYKDLRAQDWVFSSKGDVAAARFVAGGHADLHLMHIPAAVIFERFIPDWKPDLGDRVYFLGLLSVPGARGMIERNVPMVRSGTIGAMYQPDVPHKWPDGTIRRMEAHLIDCRAYRGFSGSPCFYQRDGKFAGVTEGVVQTGPVTLMLGLVSGHLVETDDRVNTGVGLIAPAERIQEVLLMPEFAEERERVMRERQKEQDQEGAELDDAQESEFERFERLAKHVVNEPKPNTAPDDS